MAALSGAGRSMAGGESPFRGPAPAPEGSPAIVLALRDALRRRNAASLQRRAVAGGLLGGDSAFRDGHVVSPPGW